MENAHNATIIIDARCPYFTIHEEVKEPRCVRRLTEIRELFEARAKTLRDNTARLTVRTSVKEVLQ